MPEKSGLDRQFCRNGFKSGAPCTAREDPHAEASLGLHFKYAFGAGEQRGAAFGNPLFDLLAAVLEGGSIRHAARALGMFLPICLGIAQEVGGEAGRAADHVVSGPARPADAICGAAAMGRAPRAHAHAAAHRGLRSDLARVLADARDQRHQLLTCAPAMTSPCPFCSSTRPTAADLHLDIGFQGSVDACAP